MNDVGKCGFLSAFDASPGAAVDVILQTTVTAPPLLGERAGVRVDQRFF